MQTATRKARNTLSLAAWEKVQALYERGETNVEIGKSFKISSRTVSERALRYGWKRPGKPESRRKGNRAVSASESPAPVETVATLDTGTPGLYTIEQSATPALPVITGSMTPEEFQSAVSGYLKTHMALGAKGLESPKSWAEMKMLFEMVRKADGLDQKAKESGPAGMVRPMRTLSRRTTQVVDLEEEIDVDRMLGE